MTQKLYYGIIFSFITMVLWALHDVSARFVAVHYDVNPFIFICLMFFASSVILLGVSGAGNNGISTLKRGHTWFYGLINIGMNLAEFYALLYITSTEMNFLNRMTVLMSLIATWVVFNRKPYKSDIIGASMVLAGLSYIIYNLPEDVRAFAFFSVFISAALSTASAMVGESHQDNLEANTFKDQARVTGFVLLACSLLFLFTTFSLGYAKSVVDVGLTAANPILSIAPDIANFMDRHTFYAALALGFTVVPLSMYFFFIATKTAKTETFMIVSSTLPFLTFLFEWIAKHLGLLNIRVISMGDISAGVAVAAGAFLMQYMRYIHDKKHTTPDSKVASTSDDYDMVCAALDFCKGDMLLCAKKLGVSIEELEDIHNHKGDKGFDATGNKYRLILRNYHNRIATVDPLTGLVNKDALNRSIEDAIQKNIPFCVAFMDLNKFKPINDTYGHEAGDIVLKTVAERFQTLMQPGGTVARIGGDEFVALFTDTLLAEAHILMAEIIQHISQPIEISPNVQVEVGGSVGISESVKDGHTAAALIHVADQRMYENKREHSER